MSDDRVAKYRKLVRWYPQAWRARNGEAVISTLMDADDAAGRAAASFADRKALVAGGLYERILAPERLSRFGLTALICSVVFSLGYQSVITWSPGLRSAGTLGPFANPSVIVSVMLVAALVLALASRGRSAQFVALLSVATIIIIGVSSAVWAWLGPGFPTVVILAGFGLMAASPLRSSRDAARAAAALLLVIMGIVLSGFAVALRVPVESPIGVAEILGAAAAFLGALTLAWPRTRALHARSSPA